MSTKKTLGPREILITFGGFLIIALFLWLLFFLTEPISVFLILAGVLFAFFVSVNPLYGLFLLLILRPTLDIFASQSILSISNYSLNIASVLAIFTISFCLITLLGNFKKIRSLPLKLPLFLFIFISLASIFFSFNPALGTIEWLRILSIFSMYLLGFILIKNPDDFKKLIYVIIFSAVIPGLTAFYQFFTRSGMTIIDESISNRIFGTFAHPNLFAYYLTIPLTLSIFLILNKQKYFTRSFLIKLSAACFFILLLLTYTRGAWAVFLMIIFILGIIRYKKFLFGSAIALMLLYFIVPPLNTRVNNLFEYDPYSSISWRINLWKDSIRYSQEKIVLGHGLGTANELILDRRGERFGSPDPHNDYLKILIETGFLGITAYLILIIALLFNLSKRYFNSDSAFAKNLFLLFIGISIGLYIMSFADNILRNTALQWTFWILLGGLFSAYPRQKNKTKFT